MAQGTTGSAYRRARAGGGRQGRTNREKRLVLLDWAGLRIGLWVRDEHLFAVVHGENVRHGVRGTGVVASVGGEVGVVVPASGRRRRSELAIILFVTDKWPLCGRRGAGGTQRTAYESGSDGAGAHVGGGARGAGRGGVLGHEHACSEGKGRFFVGGHFKPCVALNTASRRVEQISISLYDEVPKGFFWDTRGI